MDYINKKLFDMKFNFDNDISEFPDNNFCFTHKTVGHKQNPVGPL